jgi:tripartite-type tricarboxylate transporter receptor subunit TctC
MSWLAALAAASLALSPWPAEAQAPYPGRPVKIVAPALPGGGVDLIARTVADQLARMPGLAAGAQDLARRISWRGACAAEG